MGLVVVGGQAAGLSAASRARRIDQSLDITVLEKGSRISYGACGLPYFIEGQVRKLDDLTVYTPDFFERDRNIRIRANAEVVAVEHPKREIVLQTGERVRYDRLVWAAGARPKLRFTDPRVFDFHTAIDAERLQRFLDELRPKTAAIVGGSYIGLEMVTALRARGLKVELFEATDSLLQRHDSHLTALVAKRLERCCVMVRFNTRVADPSSLPHDLILATAGLAPNVEALAAAGAEIGRSGALRVSDRCETTLHGVYAAGDCCETDHIVTNRPAWIPLGTTANKMGRVAGANAAGRRDRFQGIAGTSIVRVCGLGVASTGLSEAQARAEGFHPVVARIEAKSKPKYFLGRPLHVELIADSGSGRLLGGSVVGDDGALARIDVIATALAARMKVEDLAAVDFAYTPPFAPVMEPLLIVAQQLLKDLGRSAW
jgi:CoA-dependent NAD(P)H sulfur oxidoreductase